MRGIRHLLRDFTATAVEEHLRSQLDSAQPKLTRNELELLRFLSRRTVDWQPLLGEQQASR
jgi:hypothetical protein